MNMQGMTKKDLLNAKGGSTSLQTVGNSVITVTGLATDTTIDQEGKTVDVSYLACSDGTIYGAISATVFKSVDFIIDAVSDGDLAFPMDIRVNMPKSKGGREFLTLTIL